MKQQDFTDSQFDRSILKWCHLQEEAARLILNSFKKSDLARRAEAKKWRDISRALKIIADLEEIS